MRSAERLSLSIILGLCVLLGGTAGATAYAWQRAGTVRIEVHEMGPGGSDVSVQLPGLLVNAAIALCPVPTDPKFREHIVKIEPMLRAVASRLQTLPDAVLIDVKNEDGTLRVEKSGNDLVIRVVSHEERVEIVIPVTSVRRLMEKLEA